MVPFARSALPHLPGRQTPSVPSSKATSSRKPAFPHVAVSCTCSVVPASSSPLELELLEGRAGSYSRGIHGAGSANLQGGAEPVAALPAGRGAPPTPGFSSAGSASLSSSPSSLSSFLSFLLTRLSPPHRYSPTSLPPARPQPRLPPPCSLLPRPAGGCSSPEAYRGRCGAAGWAVARRRALPAGSGGRKRLASPGVDAAEARSRARRWVCGPGARGSGRASFPRLGLGSGLDPGPGSAPFLEPAAAPARPHAPSPVVSGARGGRALSPPGGRDDKAQRDCGGPRPAWPSPGPSFKKGTCLSQAPGHGRENRALNPFWCVCHEYL